MGFEGILKQITHMGISIMFKSQRVGRSTSIARESVVFTI